jgi:hypothetical protein
VTFMVKGFPRCASGLQKNNNLKALTIVSDDEGRK